MVIFSSISPGEKRRILLLFSSLLLVATSFSPVLLIFSYGFS